MCRNSINLDILKIPGFNTGDFFVSRNFFLCVLFFALTCCVNAQVKKINYCNISLKI